MIYRERVIDWIEADVYAYIISHKICSIKHLYLDAEMMWKAHLTALFFIISSQLLILQRAGWTLAISQNEHNFL